MTKRLRSLASLLWDSDIDTIEPEDAPHGESADCKRRRLEDENSKLVTENERLRMEVALLRVPRAALKTPPQLGPSKPEFLKAWPKQSWVMSLRADLIGLPRVWEEILPELSASNNADGCIAFELCQSPKASASAVLKHAEQSVRRLFGKHPAVYKVGISSSPLHRWTHSVYGYARDRYEKWQGMKVVAASDTSFSAGLVESFLINQFQGQPGCRNERPGGETPDPGEGPHFTYVVYRILVPPARIVSSGL